MKKGVSFIMFNMCKVQRITSHSSYFLSSLTLPVSLWLFLSSFICSLVCKCFPSISAFLHFLHIVVQYVACCFLPYVSSRSPLFERTYISMVSPLHWISSSYLTLPLHSSSTPQMWSKDDYIINVDNAFFP